MFILVRDKCQKVNKNKSTELLFQPYHPLTLFILKHLWFEKKKKKKNLSALLIPISDVLPFSGTVQTVSSDDTSEGRER